MIPPLLVPTQQSSGPYPLKGTVELRKSHDRHTTALLQPHHLVNLNAPPFFLGDLRQSKCRLCSNRLAPSRGIDCSEVLTFF